MDPRAILVVNAGSTNLKLQVVGAGEHQPRQLPAPWPRGRELSAILRQLGPVDAVAHRVVHGGRRHAGPVRISPAVVRELGRLADLAPLHQPPALATIRAARMALPGVPQVACFDTAFHHSLPPAALTYPVPTRWRSRWGVRRYGFHGLAHRYLAGRAADILGRPLTDLRIVTCQLGGGASLAAVLGGVSVDTTMGFTPLEGLMMATRSGSVDPGLLTWLGRRHGLRAAELERVLERESGLLALAGTSDMRRVVERAGAGDPRAGLALDVYLHRLVQGVAAMTAALGGLDALVFGGGVGQNSARVREGAVERLRFLGLRLDRARNEEGTGDRRIEPAGQPLAVLVVATREDLEMARETRELLGWGDPGGGFL